jgi:hypothetical protein
MIFLMILALVAQQDTLIAPKSEHEIGEEVIKGTIKMTIQDPKLYLYPPIKPFAPLESIISQEKYIFDDKLYAAIDAMNTPILYLHSEYLRIPLVSRLMYGNIALFVPRFEKTVSSWELVITDANGQVVRRYAQRGLPPSSLFWDGRTDNGEMCNMGEVYNYVFTAFDAIGNQTRIPGRSYTFNGVVYEEKNTKTIAVSSGVLFNEGSQVLVRDANLYLDEIANIIKDSYKKEVVIYSYSESEALAKSRGEVIMNEIINRAVLPSKAIKTAPRFIPGLLPKYSKIEVVVQ